MSYKPTAPPSSNPRRLSSGSLTPRSRYNSSLSLGSGQGFQLGGPRLSVVGTPLRGAFNPGSLGSLSSGNQQQELKGLNERLAGYLGKVKDLEARNAHLDKRIQGALVPTHHLTDWGAYEKPVGQLRQQVMDMMVENVSRALQVDNGRLAADDFKVKWEAELSMRQSVQQDITGLRKILDDTNLGCRQMESQIEALKEELMFLRKNHQEEVENLKTQIANSSVSVHVNDSKNVDLSDIMLNIREKYEKIADQNREDMEQMYKIKFQDLSQSVARSNDIIQLAKRDASNLRRQVQPLEAELNGLLIQNRSLEQALGETEDRWTTEVEELNRTIARLEQELRTLYSHIEQQAEEYQSLLDVKCKLDQEIRTYQDLLEKEDIQHLHDRTTAPITATDPVPDGLTPHWRMTLTL